MQTGHKVEIIRLDSGERFPLLISRATSMPCSWACRFSHTYHRSKAVKTAEAELTGIACLYQWADENHIDLTQRIDSGRMLTPPEVALLSDHVRLARVEPKKDGKKRAARIVVGNTHKGRMTAIVKFIKWRMSHVTPGIVDTAKAHDVRVRIAELKEQVKGLVAGSRQAQREALTDEQVAFLVAVTHPDHPENPFKRITRHRNHALVLMYVELGVREAEPLVLKGPHVQINGPNPRIVIVPNPHDPDDVRKDAPQVKTNGRSLPTSKPLSAAIDFYVTIIRPKVPGAKKQPFIFLSTEGGSALSLDAVYDIFRVLRKRFPDNLPRNLSTHLLRHTWNSRFLAVAKSRGLAEPLIKAVNNYLMGWTKTSGQGKRYGHTQIVRESDEVLMALQVSLAEALA